MPCPLADLGMGHQFAPSPAAFVHRSSGTRTSASRTTNQCGRPLTITSGIKETRRWRRCTIGSLVSTWVTQRLSCFVIWPQTWMENESESELWSETARNSAPSLLSNKPFEWMIDEAQMIWFAQCAMVECPCHHFRGADKAEEGERALWAGNREEHGQGNGEFSVCRFPSAVGIHVFVLH